MSESLNPRKTSLSGLGFSDFARRYSRNHVILFSCGYWDVSLRRVLLRRTMNSSVRLPEWIWHGFPIRRSTDQGLLAAHRGLSQLATSFFASWHQGIHHMLLLAWSQNSSHLSDLCSANVYNYFLLLMCSCQRTVHSKKFLENFERKTYSSGRRGWIWTSDPALIKRML